MSTKKALTQPPWLETPAEEKLSKTLEHPKQAEPKTAPPPQPAAMQQVQPDSPLVDAAEAIGAITRSEWMTQTDIARRYPRSIEQFKRDAETLVTLDVRTAAKMFFRVPRGGKMVEGPSIRLAEIVASCWQHVRYGSRIAGVGERTVTAQGFAVDLQNNVSCTVEVPRRIFDSNGRRYSEDLIITTALASSAIARRNAIRGIVPEALTLYLMDKAKKTVLGENRTMEQRRKDAVAFFDEYGAKEKDVLAVLGRKGMDDVTMDDILTLRGMATAIEDGETTWAKIYEESKGKHVVEPDGKLSVESISGGEVTAKNV